MRKNSLGLLLNNLLADAHSVAPRLWILHFKINVLSMPNSTSQFYAHCQSSPSKSLKNTLEFIWFPKDCFKANKKVRLIWHPCTTSKSHPEPGLNGFISSQYEQCCWWGDFTEISSWVHRAIPLQYGIALSFLKERQWESHV